MGDQNDANLGAVTNNDENGEVTHVNIIHIKGVAQKLEPQYKLFCQVQTRLKHRPLKEPISILRQKKLSSKQPQQPPTPKVS